MSDCAKCVYRGLRQETGAYNCNYHDITLKTRVGQGLGKPPNCKAFIEGARIPIDTHFKDATTEQKLARRKEETKERIRNDIRNKGWGRT